jgi:hypothetical protein
MKTLRLSADMQAAVNWLQAINTQSWNAPAPPPKPARPIDVIASGYYDTVIAPNWDQIVSIYNQLAGFRVNAATPYVPTAADYGGGAP